MAENPEEQLDRITLPVLGALAESLFTSVTTIEYIHIC